MGRSVRAPRNKAVLPRGASPMTSHRWTFTFSCADCGRRCEVKVVEDGDPPFTEAPRRRYEASEGTRVSAQGTITCACGAAMPSPA